ncbi:MAG TPA: sulfurtransferase [Paenibacillaceae bacterium]|nr:sulfurtransferase [Paenibacillaceae bacterium]
MNWIGYALLGVVVLLFIKQMFPMKGLKDLSSEEVSDLLKKPKDFAFIDVREVHEYKSGHIKGFKNIPLSQLSQRLNEIDGNKQIVLTCRSGNRSRTAAKILMKNKFPNLAHLKTGISGWSGSLSK